MSRYSSTGNRSYFTLKPAEHVEYTADTKLLVTPCSQLIISPALVCSYCYTHRRVPANLENHAAVSQTMVNAKRHRRSRAVHLSLTHSSKLHSLQRDTFPLYASPLEISSPRLPSRQSRLASSPFLADPLVHNVHQGSRKIIQKMGRHSALHDAACVRIIVYVEPGQYRIGDVPAEEPQSDETQKQCCEPDLEDCPVDLDAEDGDVLLLSLVSCWHVGPGRGRAVCRHGLGWLVESSGSRIMEASYL